MQQSAITFEPMGTTGRAYGQIGLGKVNLFIVHLGGKRRFKGPKTIMLVKLVRFCKVWPSLVCGLLTVNYGIVP